MRRREVRRRTERFPFDMPDAGPLRSAHSFPALGRRRGRVLRLRHSRQIGQDRRHRRARRRGRGGRRRPAPGGTASDYARHRAVREREPARQGQRGPGRRRRRRPASRTSSSPTTAQADVKLKITDPEYAPLRQRHRGDRPPHLAVRRRQPLHRPAAARRQRAARSRTAAGSPRPRRPPRSTSTSCSSMLDKRAQADLQGVIQGFGTQYDGRVEGGRRAAGSTSTRRSRRRAACSRSSPTTRRRSSTSSSRRRELVTDVAERRDDLAGLVDRARRRSPAPSPAAAPSSPTRSASCRRSCAARTRRSSTCAPRVDDLRPLVEESKPVDAEAAPLPRRAAPARPRRAPDGPRPVDASSAARRRQRPRRADARPARAARHRRRATSSATARSAAARSPRPSTRCASRSPSSAYARPYAVDLTGWFDDFGHSGLYDALGGKSRVGTYVNAFAQVDGVLQADPGAAAQRGRRAGHRAPTSATAARAPPSTRPTDSRTRGSRRPTTTATRARCSRADEARRSASLVVLVAAGAVVALASGASGGGDAAARRRSRSSSTTRSA